MGNIIIAKTWQDSVEPFGKILLRAEGNDVSAQVQFYIKDAGIAELAEKLTRFAQTAMETCTWSSGPDCTLRLLRRDLAKHIRIEVSVRVDDEDSHICTFYVDGIEAWPLECFAANLSKLKPGETIRVY